MAEIALTICPSRAAVHVEKRRARRTPQGSGVQSVRTVNDRPVRVHTLAFDQLNGAEAQVLRETFAQTRGVLPVEVTLPDASLVDVHLPTSITLRKESPDRYTCSFDAEEVR